MRYHTRIARRHRNEPTDRREGRHQDGAESVAPRLHECTETIVSRRAQAIRHIDQNDRVIDDNPDEDDCADPR